jgi:hypothetical protein
LEPETICIGARGSRQVAILVADGIKRLKTDDKTIAITVAGDEIMLRVQ